MTEENQNKVIAQAYLKQAIQHKNSERPIGEYIKFMDSLDNMEKEYILLDKGTTELIDKINRITECEIELNLSRSLK